MVLLSREGDMNSRENNKANPYTILMIDDDIKEGQNKKESIEFDLRELKGENSTESLDAFQNKSGDEKKLLRLVNSTIEFASVPPKDSAMKAYDIVLIDENLNDQKGSRIIKNAASNIDLEHIKFILYSQNLEPDTAVMFAKDDANFFTFLDYDAPGRVFAFNILRAAYELSQQEKVVSALQENVIIGVSSGIQTVREEIERIAKYDVPVFIDGDRGTGKELVAENIRLHSLTHGRTGKYRHVNCAAFPEGLMESELFGHKQGSFTGATADKKGIFEVAHNGTVFLDEIGDMPTTMQAKLLTFLENGIVRKVGAMDKGNKVNVRIISATNKRLYGTNPEVTFKEDLFDRISTYRIYMPPLKERPEDIRLLSNHCIEQFNNAVKENYEITEAAYARLQSYDFPGNVRELFNIIKCAAIKSDNNIITEREVNKAINQYKGEDQKNNDNSQLLSEMGHEYLSGLATTRADKAQMTTLLQSVKLEDNMRYLDACYVDATGSLTGKILDVNDRPTLTNLSPKDHYDAEKEMIKIFKENNIIFKKLCDRYGNTRGCIDSLKKNVEKKLKEFTT